MEQYPLPDIPKFLARIEDCIRPFITDSQLQSYQEAISSLFSSHTPVYDRVALGSIAKLVETYQDSDNWATEWFLHILLSVRLPVASTQRLSLRLSSPQRPLHLVDAQITTAARYLRAFAVWSVHLRDGRNYAPTETLLKHQLDGLFATFRFPGKKSDILKTKNPSEHYAVVWSHGVGYKVLLADSDGVFSAEAIAAQLERIKSSEIDARAIPRVAAYSWRLPRVQWLQVFNDLKDVPDNKALFETLTNASISVALDDYDSPFSDEDFLNDVRQGVSSENRYADQTLILVVYNDGQVGLTADHAPTDFTALIALTSLLITIIKADLFPALLPKVVIPLEPLLFRPTSSPLLTLPASYVDPIPRKIVTFQLPNPGCKRRPLDALLNFSLQVALHQARPGRIQPIFQPVHQRAFIKGRCDAMWPVTQESIAFVHQLTSNSPVPDQINALKLTLEKRQAAIKVSQSGLAPDLFRRRFHPTMVEVLLDPSIDSQTRQSLEVIIGVWTKISEGNFGKPRPSISSPTNSVGTSPALETCIHFTGVSLPPRGGGDDPPKEGEIVGGLSNVYLRDHLVLFYLIRSDGTIFVSINAVGSFESDVDEIAKQMQIWYPRVVQLYDKSLE